MHDRTDLKRLVARCCHVIAAVSALFCLVLGVLLVANGIQLHRVQPLETPALEKMIERLRQQPENAELTAAVRDLNLAARRAYFSRQWQQHTGIRLLLGGLVVLLVAGGTARALRPLEPRPGTESDDDERWRDLARARRAVAATALLLVVGVLILHVSTPDKRRSAETPEIKPEMTAEAEDVANAQPAGPRDSAAAGSPTEPVPAVKDVDIWPAFRGPGGRGIAENADPPSAWNGENGKNVLWKTAVPSGGFSSPVVWGDTIFLTGANQEEREIYGFAAADGELLWRRPATEEGPEMLPEVTDDTGYAAPTPAVDAQRVYAVFATGEVSAFTHSGERVWSRRFQVPDNPYGHASSLLVYRDVVLVQYDHGLGGRFLGLDAASGETRWDRLRDVGTSWASPLMIRVNREPQVVLNAPSLVIAYNPVNGHELWQAEGIRGELGASPTYHDGKLFVANEYARLIAIDVATQEQLWEDFNAALPDVSSPLAVDGLLFLAASYGTVTCFDAPTGNVHWTQDFPEGFYASPIAVKDRIYVTDRNGITRCFAIADEYREEGVFPTGEKVVATPAFVGNRIYIRGVRNLLCLSEAAGQGATTKDDGS